MKGFDLEGKIRLLLEETDITKIENNFSKLVSNLTSMLATLGVSFSANAIINEMNKIGETVDYNMRQIWAITDLTKEELDSIRSKLIEISESGTASLEELTRAYYQAISSGMDYATALQLVEQAGKLAIATQSDLFRTVDMLTSVINSYKMNIQDLPALMDKIFTATKLGKTTVEELASSLSMVVPVASQVGLSLNEVLGAIVTLTLQGFSTAEAITGLNMALSNILNPSSEAIELAQQLGIEFNITALQSKGLVDFLEELYQTVDGNVEKLSVFFGSVQGARAIFGLTGQAIDTFRNSVQQIGNAVGETQQAWNKVADSTVVLKNRINALKDEALVKLYETLKPLIEGVLNIAKYFLEWYNSSSKLERGLVTLSTIVTALVPVISGLTVAINLLKASMGDVASIILLITGAITGAVSIIGVFKAKIQETNQTTQEANKSLEQTKSAVDKYAETYSKLTTQLEKSLQEAKNIQKEAKETSNSLSTIFEYATQLNNAWKLGADNVKNIKKHIDEILNQNPALAKAVQETNNGYVIQIENLKSILETLKKRLEYELKILEAQRQQIEASKIESALRTQTMSILLTEKEYWEKINESASKVKQQGSLATINQEMAQNESYTRLLFQYVQEIVGKESKYSKAKYLLEKNAWTTNYVTLANELNTALTRGDIDLALLTSANVKVLSESSKSVENAKKKIDEYIETVKKTLDLSSDPKLKEIDKQIANLKSTIDTINKDLVNLPKGKTVTIDFKSIEASATTLDSFKERLKKVKTLQTNLNNLKGNGEQVLYERKIILEELVDFYSDLYELAVVDPSTAQVLLNELKLTKDELFKTLQQAQKMLDETNQQLKPSESIKIKSLSDVRKSIDNVINVYSSLSEELREGFLPTVVATINEGINWIDNQIRAVLTGEIKGDINQLLSERKHFENVLKQYTKTETISIKNISLEQAQSLYSDVLSKFKNSENKQAIKSLLENAYNIYRSKLNEALFKALEQGELDTAEKIAQTITVLEQEYNTLVGDLKLELKSFNLEEQLQRALANQKAIEQLYVEYVTSENATREGILTYIDLLQSQTLELLSLYKQLIQEAIEKGNFEKAKEYENEIIKLNLRQRELKQITSEASESTNYLVTSIESNLLDSIFSILEQIEFLTNEFSKTQDNVKKQEIREQINNNVALLQNSLENVSDIIKNYVNERLFELLIPMKELQAVIQQSFFDSNDSLLKSFYSILDNITDLLTQLSKVTTKEDFDKIYESIKQNFELFEEFLSQYDEVLPEPSKELLRSEFNNLKEIFGNIFEETVKKLFKTVETWQKDFSAIDTSFTSTVESFFNLLDNVKELTKKLSEVTTLKDFEDLQQQIQNNIRLFFESFEQFDLPEATKELIETYANEVITTATKQMIDYKLFLQELTKLVDDVKSVVGESEAIDFSTSIDSMDRLLTKARQLRDELTKISNAPKDFQSELRSLENRLNEVIKQLETVREQQTEFNARVKALFEPKIQRPSNTFLEPLYQFYDALDEKTSEAIENKKKVLTEITKISKNIWSNKEDEIAFEEWSNKENERLTKLNEQIREIEALEKKIERLQRTYKIKAKMTPVEEITDSRLAQIVEFIKKPADSLEEIRLKMEMINELLSSDIGLTIEQEAWLTQISEELEKQKKLQEEKIKQAEEIVKKQADYEAKLFETISNELRKFGDFGGFLAIITDNIARAVREAGGLEKAFKDVEKAIELVNNTLQGLVIKSLTLIVESLANIFQDLSINFEQNFMKERTNMAEILKNYREYARLQEELNKKEATKLGLIAGGSFIGALIGAIAGNPWIGALIGGGLGALISNATIDKDIEELKKKLEDTLQKVSEVLGTSIEDIADALYNAFSEDTYTEFIKKFSNSLEQMTKEALIKSFLASEFMQPLFKNLSETITTAVLDGVLTPEEQEAIKQAYSNIIDNPKIKAFYDSLVQLFGTDKNNNNSQFSTRYVEYLSEETYRVLSRIEYYTKSINEILYSGTLNVKVVAPIPTTL